MDLKFLRILPDQVIQLAILTIHMFMRKYGNIGIRFLENTTIYYIDYTNFPQSFVYYKPISILNISKKGHWYLNGRRNAQSQ